MRPFGPPFAAGRFVLCPFLFCRGNSRRLILKVNPTVPCEEVLKNSMIRSALVLSCVLACCLPGCGDFAIPPAGSYSEVLLVTEEGPDGEWTRLIAPLIAHELDYYVDTELQFRITPIKASEFDDFPAFKNVVLCGLLSSTTSVGQIIIDMIGESGVEQVRSDGARILMPDGGGKIGRVVRAQRHLAARLDQLDQGVGRDTFIHTQG